MTELEVKKPYEFDKLTFRSHIYNDRIFLDFNIATHFGYAVDRQVFRYFDSLTNFLNDNKSIIIYLTIDSSLTNFQYNKDDIIVNIDNFIDFCDNIGYSKKDKIRAKAFFGQHISLLNLNISDSDKRKFIQANFSEQDLINSIKNLSTSSQTQILNTILALETDNSIPHNDISKENFIKIFSRFLSDGKIQNTVLENLPRIQLDTLKELKEFVKSNLDKGETFFQNWLDEDNGKYRRKRCLIFGIEYIDPKREGEIMGRKRFDILATQNRENHILIELKSPTAEIFEIDTTTNHNQGELTSYKISRELSRAIPQILGYRKWYQQLNSEKLQELGITTKKEISECIIVIGTRKENDLVWKENFNGFCDSMSIKIWTYNDLIDKMENTIQNLEENLY
jgi:hypothetical protein